MDAEAPRIRRSDAPRSGPHLGVAGREVAPQPLHEGVARPPERGDHLRELLLLVVLLVRLLATPQPLVADRVRLFVLMVLLLVVSVLGSRVVYGP